MRSNAMGVVLAVIALALAGAAYYYWTGGGKSEEAVTGFVVDKVAREAGTEAGDRTLDQGLRALTGKSLEKDVFYFIVVETDDGREVEMEVPEDFYKDTQIGDKVRRDAPDAVPVLLEPAPPTEDGQGNA